MRKYFGSWATDISLSYKWNSQIVIRSPPVKMSNAWFVAVSRVLLQEYSAFQYTRRLELTWSKFCLRKYQERGFGLKALEVQYISEMRQERKYESSSDWSIIKSLWKQHKRAVTIYYTASQGVSVFLVSLTQPLKSSYPNISRAPTVTYTCMGTKQSNAQMGFRRSDTLGMEEFPTRIHLWA